eukprot:GILK01007494.1.p1 GENE.GILK01007494.1~~GILK01007494.1.p1  ORF type:complete len:289 (-),score=45.80 GILK01007494.1:37-864(-)
MASSDEGDDFLRLVNEAEAVAVEQRERRNKTDRSSSVSDQESEEEQHATSDAEGGGFLVDNEDADSEATPVAKSRVFPPVSAPTRTFNKDQPEFADGCRHCGSGTLERNLLQDGIRVCFTCKKDNPFYSRVTKTTAQERFLLTDDDLKFTDMKLSIVSKPNPRGIKFTEMKLYLHGQMEQLAIAKWGSLENIEDARRKRIEEREKREMKKRGIVLLPKQSKQTKKRKQQNSALSNESTAVHQHTFPIGAEELVDSKTDTWLKRCECGFSVQYEKF